MEEQAHPLPSDQKYRSFYFDEIGFDPITDDFTVPSGTEMTGELLLEFIEWHRTNRLPRFERLQAAYEDEFAIFNLPKKDPWKPDNRLAASFPRCISDTFRGYFIGEPVKMQAADDSEQQWLDDYGRRNDQDDVDEELAKLCDNYGVGFELLYQNEEGRPGSVAVSPLSCFVVYDTSVLHRPLFGIRYSYDEEGRLKGSYSDAENVVPFLDGESGLEFGDAEPHAFGEVPIIQYAQNTEMRGAYEGVLNLVEAYCKAVSEKANDVEYFADAYLKVIGMKLDEGQKKDLREARIINLWGDGEEGKGIDADFLAKPNADTTQENLLDRLETLIFKMAMVPDISNEAFGTSSGIALKMRMQPMSNLAKTKEKKFKKAIRKRLRLLAQYPEQGFEHWDRVEIKMTRNMPEDLESEAALQGALAGLVSTETRLGQLPFVDNVRQEMARMDEERRDIGAVYGEGFPTARAGEPQENDQQEET
ncbi:MAG: phage portal protein [Gordonibacter sp.]|uniref:phage portal protein n=1 Tax=Gordonibacter sp. TaxID=1968902 RepID=UPI002FCC50F1